MDEKIKTVKDWLGNGSINIFGAPFSGKDTQSRVLSQLLDGVLVGGGDILRSSPQSDEIEKTLAEGGIIPSDYYLGLLLPYLSQPQFSGRPLVLSAVGRSHGEEPVIMNAAAEAAHPLKAVVMLEVPEDEIWRRYDQSKLEPDRGGRSDDHGEVLKNRLSQFREKSMPVIRFYRDRGLLIEVDGTLPKEEVTNQILKGLASFASRKVLAVYDATELDKKQLSALFNDGAFRVEYLAEKISDQNLEPDAEAISVFVTSDVTREIINAMPRLRLIACRSTGFNNVDLAAAEERDVSVVNVPTYGESTVAEYTFALLLALQRKLPSVLTSNEHRLPAESLTGHDLEGKTFGVIGTGHIGQKALKIAAGFSMKTLAFDSFPKPELATLYGFKYVGLEELLEQSDFVSLHVPYLPSTHHLMNRERLSRMKSGAVLINTARGELVDTRALIEALDSGHLSGAVIDVVEGETLLDYHEETALLRSSYLPENVLRHSVEISVLSKMPNVIISPHNAFNSVEAIERINSTTAENIVDFWSGRTPNKVAAPKKPTGKLLIARHAESEWNATGQWSGISDVHLSPKGFHEAALFGQVLKDLDMPIDAAYCSEQIRTRETLEGMLNTAQLFSVPVATEKALNERDYGEYTGKNKWQMKDMLGDEAFNNLRRGWDVPVPGGETLKMVYDRVMPFYMGTLLPLLLSGKNVLIVAHGNSIRAIMKYLESISDEDVSNLEMLFGQIVVYDIDGEGRGKRVSVLTIDTKPPNA